MDSSTMNGSTVILQDNSGTLVAGSVQYSVVTKCIWPFPCYDLYYLFFYPSSPLDPGTQYTLTIAADAKYDDGNTLGHDISYSFATRPDLGTGTWEDMSIVNAPSWTSGDTAVWTGTEMIVWGELGGGRYNPATDSWQSISTTNSPSWTSGDTAVWTGTEMIVWGELGGGRYNPTTDTWQSISTVNAPSARILHTAVWTGVEMIIWGGADSIQTGGKYNPVTDNWQGISTLGAPSGRSRHTAVWTGTEMIVWGGGADFNYYDTGGIYDPTADTWREISTIGAAEERKYHRAVWTGTEMIVWGGQTEIEVLNGLKKIVGLHTGGSYSPDTDDWQQTSTTGAPSGKSNHVAVWTGTEMIVWNGTGSKYLP
jgi:hypothetical protein